jgi:predicted RNase H-like HicB family nuclease
MIHSTPTDNSQIKSPSVDLLIEIAPGEGCFGHIPSLPGLCFRANNREELVDDAPSHIRNYIKWMTDEHLTNLNPVIAFLAEQMSLNPSMEIQLVEKERREGAPVWISGNPVVLFDYDLRPMDNGTILAYLNITQQILKGITEIVKTLPQSERTKKPSLQQRSIDEMLTHIGNCIWWYCSRIDDELAEPDEFNQEPHLARINRLFESAFKYIISVPPSKKTIVHTPTRFKTNDPNEQWTHTKVCRREAEHAWEHLSELSEIVGNAKGK